MNNWTVEEEARVAAVSARLHASGLALPAWVALECARPFSWLLGQVALVAMPAAHLLGVGEPLANAATLLAHPDQLAALSAALSPDRERHR